MLTSTLSIVKGSKIGMPNSGMPFCMYFLNSSNNFTILSLTVPAPSTILFIVIDNMFKLPCTTPVTPCKTSKQCKAPRTLLFYFSIIYNLPMVLLVILVITAVIVGKSGKGRALSTYPIHNTPRRNKILFCIVALF